MCAACALEFGHSYTSSVSSSTCDQCVEGNYRGLNDECYPWWVVLKAQRSHWLPRAAAPAATITRAILTAISNFTNLANLINLTKPTIIPTVS